MTDAIIEALDVALRVTEALDSLGVPYFIGGSLASSVQGEPRATNDIDIVVDMPLGRVHALAEALGDDFEIDQAMLRGAIMRGECANIFYLPFVMKVDLFGHAHGPFDESEFARRRQVVVADGRKLWIKSPEDTVLRKLCWYRDGGGVSDRQWRDVLGVLRLSAAELDLDYLAYGYDHGQHRLGLPTVDATTPADTGAPVVGSVLLNGSGREQESRRTALVCVLHVEMHTHPLRETNDLPGGVLLLIVASEQH